VDAKKRDSYRCVGCSRTSSGRSNRLDVHHIIPYGAFEDLVKAHDLSNLVTLCRRCHYMVHNELASVKLVDGSFVWVSKI
jgi:5-methylcytosine-specific restriction endonuclease McrA